MNIYNIASSILNTVIAIALNVSLSHFCIAQAPPLSFDVASVKYTEIPHGPTVHLGFRINSDLGTFACDYCSMESLLEWAFGLEAYQIQGPAWLGSTLFEINARMPSMTSLPDCHEMVQALLTERFGLAYTTSETDQAVLCLRVVKGGPMLRPSDASPASLSYGTTYLHAHRMSMEGFCKRLSKWLEVPVLNETGLKSMYDIDLAWARSGESDGIEGGLVDLVRRQLGLTLQRSRRPLTTMIITHLKDRPTPN